MDGDGFLFAGHSGAGKSTVMKILKGRSEILCDDRIIVRKGPAGFKIYGTWCHGEVPDTSANSGPLKAILFLEKSDDDRLVRVKDRKVIRDKLLAFIIKPFVTTEWWEKMFLLIEDIIDEVPCYTMYFTKKGDVDGLLKKIRANKA